MYPVFISCPKGFEYLLEKELTALSIDITKQTVGGVYASLSLDGYYRLVISSRLANRVMIQLFSVPLKEAQDLHEKTLEYDWAGHFGSDNTINIQFRGTNRLINNSMYGAQLIKDGISDYFRARDHQRPSVEKHHPDIQLHAHLKHNTVTVYIDPVGQSLHQRGYRLKQGSAPLKENVAAALLILSGWEEKAKQGESLIDPFCGSGTILIEACLMAMNAVPGLYRKHHSLQYWKHHEENTFSALLEQAKEQVTSFHGQIMGFDNDSDMVHMAKEHVSLLELDKMITISKKDIHHLSVPKHLKKGLIICNPPYGERLSEEKALVPVYQTLGKMAKHSCLDWTMGIISSSDLLLRATGLRATKRIKVKNGALDCQFVLFELTKDNHFNPNALEALKEASKMVLNRLKKNQKKLLPWLKKENIQCYRLYDADLPEYNAAVDIYDTWVHVQEYAAPKTVDEKKALARIERLCQVLSEGLGFDKDKIILKQRKRQRNSEQYESVSLHRERVLVKEGHIQCFLNLHDYIDTGLFLDHRRLRQRFETLSANTFLNLFCYTGVASLHAARGGAKTTNVDLSKTYLNWAKDNFRLNHLTIDKHEFIHADVMKWLKEEKECFDVIFCDPPSFSNSKRMTDILDVQRDHQAMIILCMGHLNEKGTLYFSCNFKKFKLNESLNELYDIKNITKDTTSKDYETARVKHQTFEIKHSVKEPT